VTAMSVSANTSRELGIQDLREELKDFGTRFRGLTENDLFVLWFLQAYLVDDEDLAARGLVGGSGDKSVDRGEMASRGARKGQQSLRFSMAARFSTSFATTLMVSRLLCDRWTSPFRQAGESHLE
jgi:hypothetical protein